MTDRKAFLGLLLLLLGLADAPVSAASLSASLDKILQMPAMRGGITGAMVARVRDGKILYSHDPDLRLLPASNRKLFTTAAGLELLGANYTWTTRVLATAKPDADGTLHGDLVLKGVGDSSLKTADLDDMAAQIAKAGVRRITGSVYGDGSAFRDDFSDEEFPQIAGLEVNDGDVAVTVTAGAKAGDAVQVAEASSYASTDIHALTEATGVAHDLTFLRPFHSSGIQVLGALPVGTTVTQNVPVDDPPRYATTVFAACLAQHGVTVNGEVQSGKPPSAAPVMLASHMSVPLGPYLALINKPSDNLLAESLVRTVGIVKGTGGSYDAGDAVEMTFFKELGVDMGDIALVDGCGVGRRNFVTARAVTQLLLGMHKQPDWQFYYDSLPIAGIDGTLKSRLKGTKAAGNVHAKTGTLSQVRCLSGYLTGAHGDLYVFSLLMNNFPGKAADAGAVQDQFVITLADSL